jgi:hypothetical protein
MLREALPVRTKRRPDFGAMGTSSHSALAANGRCLTLHAWRIACAILRGRHG